MRFTRSEYMILWMALLGPLCPHAAPGDWPEPRQNPYRTAIQPLPGAMTSPPDVLARFPVACGRPDLQPFCAPDGKEYWAITIIGGALHCFNTRGKEMWRSHPPGINYWSIGTVEDLDGDGRIEIALKSGRPTEPYGAVTLVSSVDGSLLWRYDVDPMSYAWYLHIGRYFPGEGSKQIIVLMQGYPPDKDNGYIALFDCKEPGQPPSQIWRYDFDHYTCFPPLLRTDLEGDGVDELAIITHSRMWLLDVYTGKVKQFIAWDVSPGNSRSYGLNRFVDLNGDGLQDFLCIADFAQHHEVLLNQNGKFEQAWAHGWDESVTTRKIATTWPEPPYADIDGDGKLEIILSMFNSEKENAWLIRVYDSITGELKYRFPGHVAVAMNDIDQDGKAEIAVRATSDPLQTDKGPIQYLDLVDNTLEIIRASGAKSLPENTSPAASEKAALGVQDDYARRRGKAAASIPPPTASLDFSAVPSVKGQGIPTLFCADLDTDGKNEIITYLPPGEITACSFNSTGCVNEILHYKSDGFPAIADLDGDGNLEIITGMVRETATPTVEARTPALENRVLWRSVFPPVDRPGLPWTNRPLYVCTGHFTGKDTPDLYVWAGVPLVRSGVLDGLTGRIMWERGETEKKLYWGPAINLASVYDYNHDGKEDLLFTNPADLCICDGPTGECLAGPMDMLKVFQQSSMGLYTFPAVLKQKNTDPPAVCLIGGHYFIGVLSIQGTPYWYHLPTVGECRADPEGVLQTEEGTWLMGVGRQNGHFSCLNALDGKMRWDLDLQAGCAEICAMDVDGDSRQEFVIATSHNRVYAIGDDSGTPRRAWEVEIPSGAGLPGHIYPAGLGAPILADVNKDGNSEIILPLADGYVYILGCKK
ncbi:MAG TPA: FG-GAP-like repeat-containing protein [bacterium]|nr:FG-GAP-like repeat-containing protein [bacterium]HQL61263.1 FG-GAP-like repeat-containing protein [bacterium]